MQNINLCGGDCRGHWLHWTCGGCVSDVTLHDADWQGLLEPYQPSEDANGGAALCSMEIRSECVDCVGRLPKMLPRRSVDAPERVPSEAMQGGLGGFAEHLRMLAGGVFEQLVAGWAPVVQQYKLVLDHIFGLVQIRELNEFVWRISR